MAKKHGTTKHAPVSAGARRDAARGVQTSAETWACKRCGRPAAEILAAHRLDAIHDAFVAIAEPGAKSAHYMTFAEEMRTFAERLQAPYLALLAMVSPTLDASDLPPSPQITCPAAGRSVSPEQRRCIGTTPESAAEIRRLRMRTTIEVLTILSEDVEGSEDWDIWQCDGEREFSARTGLPVPAIEALCCSGRDVVADIEAFNAWRAEFPELVALLWERWDETASRKGA